MKDTLTIGTIAGIAGTLALLLLSVIEKAVGIIEMTTFEVAAAVFLEPAQINTVFGLLTGAISHFMIGAAGAVLLAFFMKFFGKDFYWIKGLALAAFMLLVGMGFIVNIMGIMSAMRADSATTFFHIVNYLVYGIISAFIIYKYADFETVKF